MNIYLVRHGQTEFNVSGHLQGWCDSPLTDAGKQGVVATGKQFAQANIRFDAAFCSTSPRTQTTAELILQQVGQPELALQPLSALREYHFGSFEGQYHMDVHRQIARVRGFGDDVAAWIEAYRHGKTHLLAETASQIDPEGRAESERVFLNRLQTGLQQVVGQSAPDATVLVVSHGMTIAAVLKAIAPESTLYQSLPNASVTLLHFDVFKGLQLVGRAGGVFD